MSERYKYYYVIVRKGLLLCSLLFSFIERRILCLSRLYKSLGDTGQHVTILQIPGRVREMGSGGIAAIGV
jgi:hypothetical protein